MKKSSKNNIQLLREKEGLTQDKFAEKFHVSRDCVNKWENNRRYPPIDKAIMLADYYKVSVDYILSRDTCTSVDNEYIHQQLGLSDKAINQLKAYNAHDIVFNQTNDITSDKKGHKYNFLHYDLRLPFINFLLTSDLFGRLCRTMFLYSCPNIFSKPAIKFNDYQIQEVPADCLVLATEKDISDNVPFDNDSISQKRKYQVEIGIIFDELSKDYQKEIDDLTKN